MKLRGLRILIVEDEYLLARQLSHALEGEGATVVAMAPSVTAALTVLDVPPAPDIAVLDVNLTGEKVYPVAERLEQAGVPFVFCSGYDASDGEQRFRGAAHVRKPFVMPVLLHHLVDLAMPAQRKGDVLRTSASQPEFVPGS